MRARRPLRGHYANCRCREHSHSRTLPTRRGTLRCAARPPERGPAAGCRPDFTEVQVIVLSHPAEAPDLPNRSGASVCRDDTRHMTFPAHAPARPRRRVAFIVGAVLIALAAAGGAWFATRPAAPLDVAPAACVDALRTQLADAIAAGASAAPGTRPAACDGVSDKGLQDAATKVLGEQVGG